MKRAKHAQRPAYTSFGRTLTFGQLDRMSRAFAAWLQREAQLAPGDRIALMMPNILQYPIAVFGALRAGLTVVNVNPLYTHRELTHQEWSNFLGQRTYSPVCAAARPH